MVNPLDTRTTKKCSSALSHCFRVFCAEPNISTKNELLYFKACIIPLLSQPFVSISGIPLESVPLVYQSTSLFQSRTVATKVASDRCGQSSNLRMNLSLLSNCHHKLLLFSSKCSNRISTTSQTAKSTSPPPLAPMQRCASRYRGESGGRQSPTIPPPSLAHSNPPPKM